MKIPPPPPKKKNPSSRPSSTGPLKIPISENLYNYIVSSFEETGPSGRSVTILREEDILARLKGYPWELTVFLVGQCVVDLHMMKKKRFLRSILMVAPRHCYPYLRVQFSEGKVKLRKFYGEGKSITHGLGREDRFLSACQMLRDEYRPPA